MSPTLRLAKPGRFEMGAKGYTLIELLVVMVLIGLVFSLAAPRFRDAVLADNLKSTTRKLIGLIDNIRNEAIEQHTDQIIFFNLEKNNYWYCLENLLFYVSNRKNIKYLTNSETLNEFWH